MLCSNLPAAFMSCFWLLSNTTRVVDRVDYHLFSHDGTIEVEEGVWQPQLQMIIHPSTVSAAHNEWASHTKLIPGADTYPLSPFPHARVPTLIDRSFPFIILASTTALRHGGDGMVCKEP